MSVQHFDLVQPSRATDGTWQFGGPDGDARFKSWLQANGVEVDKVVAVPVQVADGALTYVHFEWTPDGFIKEQRTVPLVQSPEAFDLVPFATD